MPAKRTATTAARLGVFYGWGWLSTRPIPDPKPKAMKRGGFVTTSG